MRPACCSVLPTRVMPPADIYVMTGSHGTVTVPTIPSGRHRKGVREDMSNQTSGRDFPSLWRVVPLTCSLLCLVACGDPQSPTTSTYDPYSFHADPPPLPGEATPVPGPFTPQLVVDNQTKWLSGDTITVGFLGGTTEQRNFVKAHAVEWLQYAKIKFDFVDDAVASQAIIRVGFEDDNFSWSYVGKDAYKITDGGRTINLRPTHLDARTVIHEFGHALGFLHEHQSPAVQIPWNKQRVYDALAKNGWTKEEVDSNIFLRYSKSQTNYSAFDRQSIMLYSIPSTWVTDPAYAVLPNTVLSPTDKAYAALFYPGQNQYRHRLLSKTSAGEWKVADRFVGVRTGLYDDAFGGNFDASAVGDEVLLLNHESGANLLMYDTGNGMRAHRDNPYPQSLLQGYERGVSGDFNADGRTDLFLHRSDGQNRLVLQTASGTFADAGAVAGPLALNGYTLVVARDLNADGRSDLLFINRDGSNRLLAQTATGTFAVAGPISGPLALNGFDRVISADFNGDRRNDVFLLNYQGDNRLLLQGSDGSFALFGTDDGRVAGTKTVNGYDFVTAGDYNSDGRQDLLMLNRANGDNRLLQQEATGQFSTVINVQGYQALNGYALVAAGTFNAEHPSPDLFLFQNE